MRRPDIHRDSWELTLETCYEARHFYVAIYLFHKVMRAITALEKLMLLMSANGAVHVNVGSLGDGTMVCYLNKNHGEFTVDACKAALSLFLTAKTTGKDVRLWFRNDANPSCSKGHWTDLAEHGIYYLRAEN